MSQAAPFSPRIALLVAVVTVSTSAIFIRLAEAPPLVVSAYRCTLATLVLGALGWRECRRELRRLSTRERLLAAVAGLALALHFVTWISSLSYTTVASSLVLVTTTPLWVALMSPFVAQGRVRAATWGGIAVSVLGCVVIGLADVQGSGEDFELTGSALWGDLLALAGAWLCGIYMLAGRRLRENLSLLPYVTACYGAAAVFLLVFALASGAPLTGHSWETLGWLALVALVPQIIGHSSYNYALRYTSAALVAVVALGEVVGATLMAWACLDEQPTSLALAGGAFVIGGVLIALRAERAGG
ncbi:MAG: DMT family transporter [Planctomycetes bacterium]|nr:DMT family transporter [Planctomycetota bacterium]